MSSVKDNWGRSQLLSDWQSNGGVMIMGYEMFRNLSQSLRIKNKKQKKVFTETLLNPGKLFVNVLLALFILIVCQNFEPFMSQWKICEHAFSISSVGFVWHNMSIGEVIDIEAFLTHIALQCMSIVMAIPLSDVRLSLSLDV